MFSSHPPGDLPAILLVSGGSGAVGQLLLDTLLAQFPDSSVRISYINHLRSMDQVDQAVQTAAEHKALIVHSLVEPELRNHLMQQAAQAGVDTHDVFGDLIERLQSRLGRDALAAPGRYRALRRDYFERIEAIEFTMAHDDSRSFESIGGADIILVGVSRTGKTPLSMYLAMLGWKTANVSFLPDIGWPSELNQVNHGRVVGLIIDIERLRAHRRQRSSEVGLGPATSYSSEESLFAELEVLRAAFKQHRIPVIDVTEKPMETTAQEVIRLVTHALGKDARRRP